MSKPSETSVWELQNVNRVYQFGPFRLDRRSGVLLHAGSEVHLTAKAYATLLLLVERAGTLVTKETLLEQVWPEGFIEPANLTQTVYVLRKTLGRNGAGHTYIDTLPGRGYRFVAPVTALECEDDRTPTSRISIPVRQPRLAVIWSVATVCIALLTISLHSSTPSGAARLQVSAEAQRDYVLGRHYWSERTEPALKEGLQYFQAALKKSPHFAQAYSGLADSYSTMGYYSQYGQVRRHYFDLAEQAARQGIAIDPAGAESHASLAFVLYLEGRSWWSTASQEFQRSIALNPDYASAHEWYSWLLYSQGKNADALSQMAKARDADPLSPIINYALGYQLYYQRHYREAAAQWHQTINLAPYSDTSYYGAGLADEQLGRTSLAVTEFRKALAITPTDPDIMGALGHVYASMRRPHDAEQLLRRIAQINPTPAYSMAVIAEGLGERRVALKWLAIAKSKKDLLLQDFDLDPRFDRLRQEYRKNA